MKILVSLSSSRLDKLESLAEQFRKLKCSAKIAGNNFMCQLHVINTKYPFHWCIKHLGWDEVEHFSGQHGIYARKDGSFRLKFEWYGKNILTPQGGDWDKP